MSGWEWGLGGMDGGGGVITEVVMGQVDESGGQQGVRHVPCEEGPGAFLLAGHMKT